MAACGGASGPDFAASEAPAGYTTEELSGDILNYCGGTSVIDEHGERGAKVWYKGPDPGDSIAFRTARASAGNLYDSLVDILRTCEPEPDISTNGTAALGILTTVNVIDGPAIGDSSTWFSVVTDIECAGCPDGAVSGNPVGESPAYGVLVRTGDWVVEIIATGSTQEETATYAKAALS